MRKLLYIFLVCISLTEIRAQHYQFSQFYAAQTYLNPAFTGANPCTRFSGIYRNQWSAIPGTFTTYQASFDKPAKLFNGGFGGQFFSDRAGLGGLKTTQFTGLTSVGININREISSRAGVSAGFVQRGIDYSGHVFGDQMVRNNASATLDNVSTVRTFYMDLGAGYLIYSAKWWGGLSFNHMNRPNQSLMGENSPLPMEIKLHGGYKYMINEDPKESSENHNVTITGNYKKQNKYNQIDIGAYYNRGYLVLGVWYRGIPIWRPVDYYRNNDAIVFLAGFANDKFQIGYSFDMTVSKLQFNNTHGTHEVSLSYLYCSKKRKKKRPIVVSCPKF